MGGYGGGAKPCGVPVGSNRCVHRCVAEKGEDSTDCAYHKRFYRSICPDEWVRVVVRAQQRMLTTTHKPQLEKWEELRSEDNWFGKY